VTVRRMKEGNYGSFVVSAAAKCQSGSRRSQVTSSCDVITPPTSISDVDDDVLKAAVVVCPGSLYLATSTVNVSKKSQISSPWETRLISELWYDHTVLLATRCKRTHPALTPASKARTRFTYP